MIDAITNLPIFALVALFSLDIVSVLVVRVSRPRVEWQSLFLKDMTVSTLALVFQPKDSTLAHRQDYKDILVDVAVPLY